MNVSDSVFGMKTRTRPLLTADNRAEVNYVGRRPNYSGHGDLGHLPNQEVQRGKDFALWLEKAMRHGGFKRAKHLADAANLSPVTIGIYLNNGYDRQLDKIRQPEPETIARIAAITGYDENEGREAAGFTIKTPKLTSSSEVAALAENLRAVASQLERGDANRNPEEQTTERPLDPAAVRILDYYERIPEEGPYRELALGFMKTLLRKAKEEYGERTDIIGKPPPDDDMTRISADEDE